jgi:hypothetical protein
MGERIRENQWLPARDAVPDSVQKVIALAAANAIYTVYEKPPMSQL